MSELDCNALSAAKGIWIDGDRLAARPDDGFHAAQIMLREPATRAGLCILTASQIIDRGLPTDRFQSIRLVGLDGTAPNGELDIGRLRGMIGPHVDDTAQWPGWQ
jgi:hypothetical protein